MKILFNLLVLFLFHHNVVYSQSEIEKKLELRIPEPATPSIASLMRMIDHPVDLCYGVPEITIPLYEIDEGSIRLPISLSYHSSGLRATDRTGLVGLGWTLNAVPTISRTVQGLRDEQSSSCTTSIEGDNLSFLASGNADGEPDIFYYKLLGKGGKFFIDRTNNRNEVKTAPYEPIKISRERSGFKVIDDNGLEYYFDKETASSYTSQTTQWSVSKIVSPSKNESVFFEYGGSSSYVPAPVNEQLAIEVAPICNPVKCTIDGIYNTQSGASWPFMQIYKNGRSYYYNIDIKGKSAYEGRVEKDEILYFNPPFPIPRQIDQAWEYHIREIRLTNVIIKFITTGYDRAENQMKEIQVLRRSDNSILRSIIFDINQYKGTLSDRRKLSSITIKDSRNVAVEKYYFDYYDEYLVPSTISTASDFWGFANTPGGNSDIVFPDYIPVNCSSCNGHNQTNTHINTIGSGLGRGKIGAYPNFNVTRAGVLHSITYPTGRKSTFEYEPNQHKGIELGGLRIKTIKESDTNPTSELIREFSYDSGTPIFKYDKENIYKYYTYNRTYLVGSNSGSISINRTFWLSKPIVSVPVSIYYDKVTEFRVNQKNPSDKEKISYLYSSNKKSYSVYSGMALAYEVNSDYYSRSIDETNATEPEGLLLEKNIYSRDPYDTTKYALVQSEINKYNTYNTGKLDGIKTFANTIPSFSSDNGYFGWVRNNPYSINYGIYTVYTGVSKLASKEIRTYINSREYIYKMTNYFYDNKAHFYPTRISSERSDGDYTNIKYIYPQDTVFSPHPYLPEERGRIKLIDNNQLSTILQQSTQNKNHIWEEKIRYELNSTSGLSLPYAFTSGYQGTSRVQKEIKQYDKKGNILEYKDKDEVNIILVWSYSQQRIIATLKNVSYSDAENAIKVTMGVSDMEALALKPILSSSEEDKLRNLHKHVNLKDAICTTYTYDPAIGLSSMTDPQGLTTYYGYDPFGRLKETYFYKDNIVKTENKQIIQTYDYHYQNK